MTAGDNSPANLFSVDFGKNQVETVKAVSGATLGFDAVETKQVAKTGQTIIRNQAENPTNGDITITRCLDKSNVLTQWVKNTLIDGKPDQARTNVTITQYDAHGRTQLKYHLTNAFAVKWEGGEAAGDEANAAVETVTIAYEQIEVESVS